jgi:hypothetical protein
LTYSLTLKMEATCFSETSVDFQRTKRRYVPEDIQLFITTAVRTSSYLGGLNSFFCVRFKLLCKDHNASISIDQQLISFCITFRDMLLVYGEGLLALCPTLALETTTGTAYWYIYS